MMTGTLETCRGQSSIIGIEVAVECQQANLRRHDTVLWWFMLHVFCTSHENAQDSLLFTKAK